MATMPPPLTAGPHSMALRGMALAMAAIPVLLLLPSMATAAAAAEPLVAAIYFGDCAPPGLCVTLRCCPALPAFHLMSLQSADRHRWCR